MSLMQIFPKSYNAFIIQYVTLSNSFQKTIIINNYSDILPCLQACSDLKALGGNLLPVYC